jgi:purine-binding chemotaxis protein CheW
MIGANAPDRDSVAKASYETSMRASFSDANPKQEPPGLILVVFEIAGQFCAIPVDKVQEIVPMAELARVPGQPSLLEGFLNLRGTTVPVVRIDRLYCLPALTPELHTPLIVLRGESHPTALLVNRVLGIVSVPADALLPIGERNSFNDCAVAQAADESGPIHVLDCKRLLLEKERQSIAEFRTRAQRYLDELENRPA